MLGRHLGSPWSSGALGMRRARNIWIETTAHTHRAVIRITGQRLRHVPRLSDHGNVGGRSVVLSAKRPVVLATRVGSVITMKSSQPICANPIKFYGSSPTQWDPRAFTDLGPDTFVVRKPMRVVIYASNEPSEQYAAERLRMLREEVIVIAGP